jgi:hypothetical protein
MEPQEGALGARCAGSVLGAAPNSGLLTRGSPGGLASRVGGRRSG